MAQIQEKSSSDAINYWISFVINWQTRVISYLRKYSMKLWARNIKMFDFENNTLI